MVHSDFITSERRARAEKWEALLRQRRVCLAGLVAEGVLCVIAVLMAVMRVTQVELTAFIWVALAVFTRHFLLDRLSEYDQIVGDLRMLEVTGGILEDLYAKGGE